MLRFEVNGIEVIPNEVNSFTLALGEQGQISIPDTLVFSGASARPVLDWVASGKIVEKIPLNIWNEGTQIYRGFLDLQDNLVVNGDREVEVKAVSYDSIDWINEFGNSVSFGVLESKGIITRNDYVPIQYVQNYRPDVLAAITAGIGLYNCIDNLIKFIKGTSDIANLSWASTTLSENIRNAIEIIIKIIYLIAQIVAIIALLKQLVIALFGERGEYRAILLRTLFERGCEYFNLSFQSSIFRGEANNLVFIPAKDGLSDKGIPNPNSPLYFFGDFLTQMQTVFNAEVKIINGVMFFERWDSFQSNNDTILKSNFNDQERLLTRYTYNTDEAIGNYNIVYPTDSTEYNTLDDTSIAFQESIDNVKGLTQITLPFAQGKKKGNRSDIEKNLKKAVSTVNKVIGSLGSRNNSVSVNSQNGKLALSSPLFSVDKIAFRRGKNIDEVPASYWWDNFHSVNSYTVNQWINYDSTPMELTFEEFREMVNNNLLISPDGNQVQIISATYLPSTNKAEVQYREKTIYAKGLNAKQI